MREPEDKHYCPLKKCDIYWGGYGGCYEIQEVREDSMDMELLPEPINIDDAERICEKCRWCYVREFENAHD